MSQWNANPPEQHWYPITGTPANRWNNPPQPWAQVRVPRSQPNFGSAIPPAPRQLSARPQIQFRIGQYPPYYRRPRQKKGHPLLIVGVVLLVIFLGTTLANLLGSGDDGGGVRGIQQYQNENYQVPQADPLPPDVPIPETFEEAKSWLLDNPIYEENLARPVRCEMVPIDLQTASKAQLAQHMNDYTACLMRVFGPAIESAGFVAVRPTVTVYASDDIETACGKMPSYNAAYCMADQQIYYASNLPDIIPNYLVNQPFLVESVLAHEFGHAVQARTGILISERAWEYEYRDDEQTANDYSRRTELQADCWAGQFNGSVAQSLNISDTDQRTISELFFSLGDDQLTGESGDHGSSRNRQSWYLDGASLTNMGACNTFTANQDKVR
uniref:neutral zinc metallopeptidase n=1 Tax=Vaginimicrobium propionicum TaxID=1871034 RepID=UPI0012EC84BC|nr:neutral zinc metallopeptidase [Vaginimicrobium propionicum]